VGGQVGKRNAVISGAVIRVCDGLGWVSWALQQGKFAEERERERERETREGRKDLRLSPTTRSMSAVRS
jgi:hypothetical protein